MSFKFPKKLPEEWHEKLEKNGSRAHVTKSGDPRFGYEVMGGSNKDTSHMIQGSKFLCPEDGVAESITVHVYARAGSPMVKCAIYDSSLNFVAETEEKCVSYLTRGWITFPFTYGKAPSLRGGEEYWLVAWCDYQISMYYDAGETDQSAYQPKEFPDGPGQTPASCKWPDPLSPSGYENRVYSIYCNYTTEARPPPPNWFGEKNTAYHFSVMDEIHGSWFTCPAKGVGNSISAYLMFAEPQTPDEMGKQKAKCAIYRRSDNSLVGVTEAIIGAPEEDWWVPRWYKFPFLEKPLLEKTDYWLLIWTYVPAPVSNPLDIWVGRNASCRGAIMHGVGWGDWFGWNPTEDIIRQVYAVYCDYTPSPVRLEVNSSPITGVPFTLDGLSEITPFSADIEMGTYAITMPETVTANGTTYAFAGWTDGPTERIRTITITADTSLTANYEVAAVKHTVNVESTPVTGIPVTVDDTSVGNTPVSVSVIEGKHTFIVPESVEA